MDWFRGNFHGKNPIYFMVKPPYFLHGKNPWVSGLNFPQQTNPLVIGQNYPIIESHY
jgi:hypothetical protein